MENNYCVYKHTTPNGKVYIGMTKQNPKKRFANGKGYKFNSYFSNAISKYGWENIRHEILHFGIGKEEAELLEKKYIRDFNSTNPKYGYNLTLGGESGPKVTDRAKAEISNKLKAYYSVEENRKKNSEAHKGLHHSEATKKKMSVSQKKRMTDEVKEAQRLRMLGKKFPNRKGHKQPEESKRKISEANKGIARNKDGRPPRPVMCIETGEIYKSSRAAGNALNKDSSSIYKCCEGTRKKAHGFTWRYAN